jgi:alpha-tubulin suppressor-like RCC1 family protein
MGAPIGFDPAPAPIPNLGQVAQVSMGYRFACARLVDTTVWCWGANELGGLGNGQMEGGAGGNLPAQIVGLKGNVSDVAAGLGGHACAVDVAGVVSCWGSNTFGQLGHDSLKDSKNCAMQACTSNPTSVAVQPAPGSKIALSSSGTCIEGDKGFRCWGGNLFGQFLTTPDGTPHPDPLAVALGADAVMSSYRGSYGTSCVITTAGSVRCWGDDSYGELGRGALITSPCAGNGTCDSTPGAVKLPTGFTPVQIATGAYWGMALSTKNRLVAWGANPDGRLGHAPGDGGDFKICGTTANAKDQRCNPTPLVIPHPGAAAP